MSQLEYERAFWGDCLNTLGEERKHLVYAGLMGVPPDLAGADVLDIGGGPVSMLLKIANRGSGCVVADPLLPDFPAWVHARYFAAGIETWPITGEALSSRAAFDEAWIYNVLQHVDDPELVVTNARHAARVVRVFEWVGLPAYDGHPHELAAADLEHWLGGSGMTAELDEQGCVGTAFFGAFGP